MSGRPTVDLAQGVHETAIVGRVERLTIAGHSPFEPTVGYSRAVRVGPHVFVSGTAPIAGDGSDPPEDAYGQMRLCLDVVLGALAQAGAAPEDVVRTRIFLTDASEFEEIGRAHAEVFGEIRPASAAVVVTALLDPRYRVEIEVDALIGSGGGRKIGP
jgi:enamine deaminase RidA (YjgF/YER057c/UK114 family)